MKIGMARVAREANVSIATVSRVMTGSVNVMEETKTRVLAVAAKYGYVPDPLISRAAASRWRVSPENGGNIIAYVKQPGSTLRPNLLGDSAFLGIKETAIRLGYKLEPHYQADYPTPRALGKVLTSRGIEGLILERRLDHVSSNDFEWSNFAAVMVGKGHSETPIHTIRINPFEQMWFAIEEVASRGYKNIGIVWLQHTPSIHDDNMRFSAIEGQKHKLAQKKIRLSTMNYVAALGGQTLHDPSFSRKLTRWMEDNQPDAVIGFNDAIFWLLKDIASFAYPQKTAYASLYKTTHSDVSDISGFAQTDRDPGRQAVHLVDTLLRANKKGCPELVTDHSLSLKWYEGQTLPRLK